MDQMLAVIVGLSIRKADKVSLSVNQGPVYIEWKDPVNMADNGML